MNNFLKGVLVGVGVGMLVAPMRGEEMRNLLAQRFNELRGALPENEQLNMYTQQVTNRVTQGASNLKDYAQQAASTVKSSANSLSDIAQNAATTVKQTGQSVADTTKQAATSPKKTTNPSIPEAEVEVRKSATGGIGSSPTTAGTTAGTTDTAPFPKAYPEYTNPETNPNR